MEKPDPVAVHESLNATIHKIKEARGAKLRDCPVCGRGRHLCDVAPVNVVGLAELREMECEWKRERGGGEASHFEGLGE